MEFIDRLHNQIDKNKSILVAGIDPRIDELPNCFTETQSIESALTEYGFAAIESLIDEVAAFKPNAAFFEQYGLPGLNALAALCSRARELGAIVILDAKRGDIGSTATAYAQAYLSKEGNGFESDAVTISPFLGNDTLIPFLDTAKANSKGLFILVCTSNPGYRDYQLAHVNSSAKTVSQEIADWIHLHEQDLVGGDELTGLGAVVGATHPDIARELRRRMPNSIFLVPGYGKQGGSLEDALAAARTNELTTCGLLINSSRALTLSFDDLSISEESFTSLLAERARKVNEAVLQQLSALNLSGKA